MTLLEFFRNEKPNAHRKKFSEILAYDDNLFENKHNFIQWLFPIDTRSKMNWQALLLTNEDIVALNNDPIALENILLGTKRFLNFLGYDIIDTIVVPAKNFNARTATWVRKNNHNHLRISRFLKFARMMGGEVYGIAQNFARTQLSELIKTRKDAISLETAQYWADAIGIDIVNAPHR